jgi:hypothetical protein
MDVFGTVVNVVLVVATLVVVWYARDTVKLARAAREDDERDRRLRQLRSVGQLVEAVRSAAFRQAMYDDPWRSAEHEQLAQALVGVEPPMPACVALAGMSTAREILSGADAAGAEVRAALQGSAAATVRAELPDGRLSRMKRRLLRVQSRN